MNQSQNMNIRVTNGNTFPIADLFDGIPVLFEPGKPETIPFDAAVHFFGFPYNPITGDFEIRPDFLHVSRRYGWNTVPPPLDKTQRPDFDAQNRKAQEYFANLRVQPVRFVMTEEAVEDESLPAPRIGRDEPANDAKPPKVKKSRKPMSAEALKAARENLQKARDARKKLAAQEAGDLLHATTAAATAIAPEAPADSGGEE